MDTVACDKVQAAARRVKKKQVKGELDRLKQAEKKKRRLEKALATSAAIRSELEKKKQNKKEEQQRLDEEGAAIAEAVALHVLLGEDSDDVMLKKERAFNAGSIDFLMDEQSTRIPCQHCSKHTLDGARYKSGDGENSNRSSYSYRTHGSGPLVSRYYDGGWGSTEFSHGLLAAQAASSLKIVEDAHVNTVIFNGMLRG